jgi:hypothetical protein
MRDHGLNEAADAALGKRILREMKKGSRRAAL